MTLLKSKVVKMEPAAAARQDLYGKKEKRSGT